MELLHTSAERPAVVVDGNGWKVFVAVHDDAYRREQRAWRQKLAASHPDRGGSAAAFRKLKADYERWRAREAAWYRSFHLSPPGFGESHRAVARPVSVRAYGSRTPVRLLALLEDGRSHDATALLSALNLPNTTRGRNTLHVAISRLRDKGVEIVALTSRGGGGHQEYMLVSRADYRAPYDNAPAQRIGALLSDGACHRASDMCAALAMNLSDLQRAISRLRKRGAAIATIHGDGALAYQLSAAADAPPSRT